MFGLGAVGFKLDYNVSSEILTQFYGRLCAGFPLLAIRVEPETAFNIVVNLRLGVIMVTEFPSITVCGSVRRGTLALLGLNRWPSHLDLDFGDFRRINLVDQETTENNCARKKENRRGVGGLSVVQFLQHGL